MTSLRFTGILIIIAVTVFASLAFVPSRQEAAQAKTEGPVIRITADFGSASDPVRATIVFQDLTQFTGHCRECLRLYHVMFKENDVKVQERLLRAMASDFRGFWNDLRSVQVDGVTNPLGLPEIDSGDRQWWTTVERSLAPQIADYFASGQPVFPTCTPMAMTFNPDTGRVETVGLGLVLHASPKSSR